MRLVSTRDSKLEVSLKEALTYPLPSHGGLWTFKTIPHIDILSKCKKLWEYAYEVIRALDTDTEISDEDLRKICIETFNIKIPIMVLSDDQSNKIHFAEMYHGKTLSFKDFGCRLVARLMKHFDIKTHILVATSGDTGSAVGQAFKELNNIPVTIYYPKDGVSEFQEKQIIDSGFSKCIEGTFDDCQDIVKKKLHDFPSEYSTCNSINIGRLLGQIPYYFYIYNILNEGLPMVISIPTGNVGNVTSALIAKQMGIPFDTIIGANNINDTFCRYVNNRDKEPKPTIPTIANAMDISNPSNLERFIYIKKESDNVVGHSVIDDDIKDIIESITNYNICPHTACALDAIPEENMDKTLVVMATAHPCKFKTYVAPENDSIYQAGLNL